MSHPKKIVILGHFGVGKTSLIRQFVDSQFSEDYLVTVGVHVKKKSVTIDNNEITLVIWDIEGNTSIDKARKSYLLGSHGFIYVFDLTRPETYANLKDQLSYLNEEHSNVPVVVLGNKADQFGTTVSKEYFSTKEFEDCLFTSALKGENVDNAFVKLTKKIIE